MPRVFDDSHVKSWEATLQPAERPPPDISRWIQIRTTCLTHGRAFLVQHTWLKLSAAVVRFGDF